MDLNNKVINEEPAIVWVGSNALEERLDSYFYNPTFIKQYSKMIKGNMGTIRKYFNVTKLSGFEYTKHFTEEALKTGEVVAITSQNVGDCELNIKNENTIKIPKKLHNELKRSKLNKDDIVLSYTGHYRRAAVITDNYDQGLHLGPNVCKLSPLGTEVDSAFLCAYFNSYSGQVYLDREKTISAQPTVNMDRIRNMEFPLPRLEVQIHIGNKVRKVIQLRKEAKLLREEAEQQLTNQLQLDDFEIKLQEAEAQNQKSSWIGSGNIGSRLDSTFYSSKFFLADKFLNSMSNIYFLKDVMEDISNGATPKGAKYLKEGIPFLRVQNIVDEIVDLSDAVYIDEKTNNNLSRSKLEQGDLLISLSGSIGHTAIFPFNTACNINQHIARVKINTQLFNNYYVSLFLNSTLGKLQQRRLITGAIQGYLSYENIYSIRIPHIDMEKQTEIGVKLQESQEKIFELEKTLIEVKKDVESLIEGLFD